MIARRIFVAGLAAVPLAVVPSAVLASPDYTGTQTNVKGESFTRPVEVQGVTVARDPGSEPAGGLPVTGGDIAGLALVGFGAVAVGTVLVRRGRTRAVTA